MRPKGAPKGPKWVPKGHQGHKRTAMRAQRAPRSFFGPLGGHLPGTPMVNFKVKHRWILTIFQNQKIENRHLDHPPPLPKWSKSGQLNPLRIPLSITGHSVPPTQGESHTPDASSGGGGCWFRLECHFLFLFLA